MAQPKNEIIKLLLLLLLSAAIMKIVFYKQDIVSTTRTALALFWMFALPGYVLLHYWRSRLEFGERIVIGTAAAAAVNATASYYLGLIGIPVAAHGIILPAAMLALGGLLMRQQLFGKRKQQQDNKSSDNSSPEGRNDSSGIEHGSGEQTEA
ncbi:hypothetical protein HYX10_01870 [Candidatus Woesearchaeota archaeon]|nr:hypothetical protein [Candidatus Woesearchaeota archaeon]